MRSESIKNKPWEPTDGGRADILQAQSLPFVVRVAKPSEVPGIVELRSEAYGRHVPELGRKFANAEPADSDGSAVLIAAFDKADGAPLGSMRLHFNGGGRRLPIEASLAKAELDLESRFGALDGELRMVEPTRLSIARELPYPSLVVRLSLFKALFIAAEVAAVEWMVVGARRALSRIYEDLLFSDTFEEGKFYPLAHAGDIPHRVMCLSPKAAPALWRAAGLPFADGVVANSFDIDSQSIREAALAAFPVSCPMA